MITNTWSRFGTPCGTGPCCAKLAQVIAVARRATAAVFFMSVAILLGDEKCREPSIVMAVGSPVGKLVPVREQPVTAKLNFDEWRHCNPTKDGYSTTAAAVFVPGG